MTDHVLTCFLLIGSIVVYVNGYFLHRPTTIFNIISFAIMNTRAPVNLVPFRIPRTKFYWHREPFGKYLITMKGGIIA